MMKRHLSSPSLPKPKRLHSSDTSEPTKADPPRTFDSLLYDEIILVIFSYLPWNDLCVIQSINRNWSRLAVDNQLWKALYINEYGRTRLRGARGFVGRSDGREIRPLPGRAAPHGEARDWKWMFRISSNWRMGRCTVSLLPDGPPPESTRSESSLSDRMAVDRPIPQRQNQVLLTGGLIITALEASSPPSVQLTSSSHSPHTLTFPFTSLRVNGTTRITALALDQSQPPSGSHVRLTSFLDSGEFFIHIIDHTSPSDSRCITTYTPTSNTPRTSPIIQAVYHHPLLVTLSQTFSLSIYDLSTGIARHTQTLSSFTSYPPTSMVLSVPTPSKYKLVLAYAAPVYPSHWSVGATELFISSAHVTSSRTTRAFDVPVGWIDDQKLQAIRQQWNRKVAQVGDTQTDGKWVVLAPGDGDASTTESTSPSSSFSPSPPSSPSSYTSSSMQSSSSLQLYRLHFPSSMSLSAVPKLTFVRTLHGQTGPVTALSLADGRCVSLSQNGTIWIWDLEAGTGAEVANAIADHEPASTQMLKGAVVFDERQIITASHRGVEVRRFDV